MQLDRFCCNKEREGKYCSECGSPLLGKTQRELLCYLEKRHQIQLKSYETRLKHNPEMCEESKARFMEKINQWSVWASWAKEQSGLSAPRKKEPQSE